MREPYPVERIQRERLDRDGFFVARQDVSAAKVERARRRILREIRTHGLTPAEMREWHDNTYFPWLRSVPEIINLAPEQTAEALVGVGSDDFWAEPQIVVKFPDSEAWWPLAPHTDELPPWAAEQGVVYKAIFGVALTDQTPHDGSPVFWIRDTVVGPHLRIGDVVVFLPETGHSGGLNLGSTIRMSVYFRLMTPA